MTYRPSFKGYARAKSRPIAPAKPIRRDRKLSINVLSHLTASAFFPISFLTDFFCNKKYSSVIAFFFTIRIFYKGRFVHLKLRPTIVYKVFMRNAILNNMGKQYRIRGFCFHYECIKNKCKNCGQTKEWKAIIHISGNLLNGLLQYQVTNKTSTKVQMYIINF